MIIGKKMLKVYNEIISEQEKEIYELKKENELYREIAIDYLRAYQQANEDLKQTIASVKHLNETIKGLNYANIN